jgi:hypothetical protein
MMSAGDFKPGSDPRRNVQQTFKPGNPHRWPPGVSGSPGGKSRGRPQFEEAFYDALMGEGTAEEAAKLLWECARAKEPWAVQMLLQRIAPQDSKVKVEFSRESADEYDLSRLSDEQFRQIGEILELARPEPLALPEGGGTPEPL